MAKGRSCFEFRWVVRVRRMCRTPIQKHFQVPRHVRFAYRKACCNSQSSLRKACNGVANAKAFPARLAGVPANAKAFPARLAELPQTPKSFPRHLRNSRKHQKVSRGTCGTPANAKAFPARLAELPQTPKSFPRYLRDSRKGQGKKRACGGSCFPCTLPAMRLLFYGWMEPVTWQSSQAISTCRA